MTIQPLVSSLPGQSGPLAASATAAASASGTGQEATVDNVSQTEFLHLLVAQIQYQDPTNPADSTAFVTQLAQFSSLEQLIGIHSDLDSLAQPGGSQNTTTAQGGN